MADQIHPTAGGHRMATCTQCQLRFPMGQLDSLPGCPHCGAALQMGEEYYSPEPADSPPSAREVVAVLDNVRSLMNVGVIFRTSDALGVKHLYLTGITPPGDHPKMARTALGSQETVGWSHHKHGPSLIGELKSDGWAIWAVEATPTAQQVAAITEPGQDIPHRIAMVVGHEVGGIDPDILAEADRHVMLPLRGIKRSVNVSTAFSMVAHQLTH
ncbi:hypothetical protein K0651_10355 [Ornithinimicrobium sp. Arc0846-15]|nr:hypothetical protein [Ornithinimicrobium laminariae]